MEKRDEKEAVESFFKDERDGSGREARTSRRPYDRGSSESDDRKRSFNPNFDRDNRVRRRPWSEERDGGYHRSEGKPAERRSFSHGFDPADDEQPRTGRFSYRRQDGDSSRFDRAEGYERRERHDSRNSRSFRHDDRGAGGRSIT